VRRLSFSTAAQQQRMVDHAIALAVRGWYVFPLHGLTPTGYCTCGAPDCGDVAKHPRYAVGSIEHGLLDATTDRGIVEQWFARWPHGNVGVATGPSGLAVIDVDVKHHGLAAWETLNRDLELPPTLESRTGSGGLHVFYKVAPGTVASSRGSLPIGIDVKAGGGYVVVPPSLHASGRRYQWLAKRDIVSLPAALRRLIQSRPTSAANGESEANDGETIGNGNRNRTLTSYAGTMRRRGMSERAITAALLVENEDRCQEPLSADEVRCIARSVARYPPAPPMTRPVEIVERV